MDAPWTDDKGDDDFGHMTFEAISLKHQTLCLSSSSARGRETQYYCDVPVLIHPCPYGFLTQQDHGLAVSPPVDYRLACCFCSVAPRMLRNGGFIFFYEYLLTSECDISSHHVKVGNKNK